ncbi:non-ribosomal peptide synthetase [Rhodococcus tibetensis]|uniref:Amino acid adenylation domain-containing protein n=1 Tax=Rhodococcus tibetensis TaxID=2965064 RepID=A0ABT1QJD6_9NOCA|nr:amino acid adenylation domain-containing protein [Rhodococcus sp. FXJ9.536]MCQ4122366.1 amino acid adenylation domain-containing protein [Rhodococcus sp. FXJ9.536]
MTKTDALLDQLRTKGVRLRLVGDRIKYTGPPDAVDDGLRGKIAQHKAALLRMLAADENWHRTRRQNRTDESFELTDLQQAYMVGEQGLEGKRPAVMYHEYSVDGVDSELLDGALRRIRSRRSAMRLAFDPEGRQWVTPPDNDPVLVVVDVTDSEHLTALRTNLIRDLPPLTSGRPYLFRLLRCPEGDRLQLALRLIAFDGASTLMLLREITRCYLDAEYRPSAERATFGDFVAARSHAREGVRYQNALSYWRSRAGDLPGPLRWPSVASSDPHPTGKALVRRTIRLSAPSWQAFSENARRHGIPNVSALFGLFAELAQRWSGEDAGTITVLLTQRSTGDPDLDTVWGNCSMTTPVVTRNTNGPFVERARAHQQALFESLEHQSVGGVEISRIRQRTAVTGPTGNLVVFTSGIDLVPESGPGFILDLPGSELVSSSLSTPQVSLDQQVDLEHGALVCTTDFDETMFSPTLIDSFLKVYESALHSLSTDPKAWTTQKVLHVAPGDLLDRTRINNTAQNLRPVTLDGPVLTQGQISLSRTAIVDSRGTLSYVDLVNQVDSLAARLIGTGVRSGDLVGLHLPRGRDQVVAALAVQRVGAAYLPADPSWPDGRIRTILEHSRVVVLVTTAPDGGLGITPGPSAQSAPDGETEDSTLRSVDDLAYVIYTSGSTGTPKGVAMSHRATANTISDLIGRFDLGSDDTVLGVSSIAFDLSVFDIFATLRVGARLVIPADRGGPSPEEWADLIRTHRVTVWNSVPQLMQLLLEHLGDNATNTLAELRLVMLSGDWVPPSLVTELHRVAPQAAVHSLGGATEAAIWSNSFDTAETPPDWPSIPYGFPLANQQMHVLHQDGSPAPEWIPGDLYIGGVGLARGYLNDPERTADHFIEHPELGRLYRTGDRARYRPGGVLEFLGRKDNQVKIDGYRIELGEVEASLRGAPGVAAAVAVVLEDHNSRILVAAVVVEDGRSIDPRGLRATAGRDLPPYMVPRAITVIEALPLSGNGKVDRNAVSRLVRTDMSQQQSATGPRKVLTEPEQDLARMWAEVIPPFEFDTESDFFACGGNSLAGMRLVNRIRRVWGRDVPLSLIFENRTLAEMASAVSAAEQRNPVIVTLTPGRLRHVLMPHPVGGNIVCYAELADALAQTLGADWGFHAFRAPGLAPGEDPIGDLDEISTIAAQEVARTIPEGSIDLVGWSMGGILARLLAARLTAAGREVGAVVAIDSYGPGGENSGPHTDAFVGFFENITGGGPVRELLRPVSDTELSANPAEHLTTGQDQLVRAGLLVEPFEPAQLLTLFRVHRANAEALVNYTKLDDTDPPTLSIGAQNRAAFSRLAPRPEGHEMHTIAHTDHYSIMAEPARQQLSELISDHLSRLSGRTS